MVTRRCILRRIDYEQLHTEVCENYLRKDRAYFVQNPPTLHLFLLSGRKMICSEKENNFPDQLRNSKEASQSKISESIPL